MTQHTARPQLEDLPIDRLQSLLADAEHVLSTGISGANPAGWPMTDAQRHTWERIRTDTLAAIQSKEATMTQHTLELGQAPPSPFNEKG